MSQLIEKLNNVARSASQTLGFRTAVSTQARGHMLVIASIAQVEGAAWLAEHLAGADAVLLGKGNGKLARAIAEIPWGVWFKAAEEKEVERAVEAGADFAVFPAASAVSLVPRNGKPGRLIQVEPLLAEGLLRTANELPVDGVLFADDSIAPLTWERLMLIQRAANLLAKPLLVPVPANISKDELKLLWETGVDGIVVEINREQPAKTIHELSDAAVELAKSVRRKRGRTEARLSSMGGTTAEAEEEEEDGDE